MATIKEVYELLKKKQAAGEKIGMFAESLIEAFENEQETSIEVSCSFSKASIKDSANIPIFSPAACFFLSSS